MAGAPEPGTPCGFLRPKPMMSRSRSKLRGSLQNDQVARRTGRVKVMRDARLRGYRASLSTPRVCGDSYGGPWAAGANGGWKHGVSPQCHARTTPGGTGGAWRSASAGLDPESEMAGLHQRPNLHSVCLRGLPKAFAVAGTGFVTPHARLFDAKISSPKSSISTRGVALSVRKWSSA